MTNTNEDRIDRALMYGTDATNFGRMKTVEVTDLDLALFVAPDSELGTLGRKVNIEGLTLGEARALRTRLYGERKRLEFYTSLLIEADRAIRNALFEQAEEQ